MAEYVVAGATGHVGSVVAQSLLDSGRKVRVIVRDTHKAERWKKRGAHVGQVDLSNVHDLLNGLRGTEAAFLILPPLPKGPGRSSCSMTPSRSCGPSRPP